MSTYTMARGNNGSGLGRAEQGLPNAKSIQAHIARHQLPGVFFGTGLEAQWCRFSYSSEMNIMREPDFQQGDERAHLALARALGAPLLAVGYSTEDTRQQEEISLGLWDASGAVVKPRTPAPWYQFQDTRRWAQRLHDDGDCTHSRVFAEHKKLGGETEVISPAGLTKSGYQSTETKDGVLTAAVRSTIIPGSLQLDVDAAQFCEHCNGVEAIFETTSSSSKPTTLIREIARKLGAQAFLIQHYIYDEGNASAVWIHQWDEEGRKVQPVPNPNLNSEFEVVASSSQWHQICEASKLAHEKHLEANPGCAFWQEQYGYEGCEDTSHEDISVEVIAA